MSDLKLTLAVDANNENVGDLYLENGTVALTATLAETVAQLIRRSLLLFKGEWFLDPTQGIPWFQSILGIKTPLSVVSQTLRGAVNPDSGRATGQLVRDYAATKSRAISVV